MKEKIYKLFSNICYMKTVFVKPSGFKTFGLKTMSGSVPFGQKRTFSNAVPQPQYPQNNTVKPSLLEK
jgi:hypothetical protein